MREYHRTTGKFLPNRKLSRQRAYVKLAANLEWRERHNAKQRERYRNDSAFRARGRARQRLYRARRLRLGEGIVMRDIWMGDDLNLRQKIRGSRQIILRRHFVRRSRSRHESIKSMVARK